MWGSTWQDALWSPLRSRRKAVGAGLDIQFPEILSRRATVTAHARACHSMLDRCALRLRTSEMGCSRYMALGSTCQGACPR